MKTVPYYQNLFPARLPIVKISSKLEKWKINTTPVSKCYASLVEKFSVEIF